MKWSTSFIHDNSVRTVIVDAPTRHTAITEGAKKVGCHRDMVVECVSLNPLSGGGSKKG